MKTALIVGAGVSRAAAPSNASIPKRPPLDSDFSPIARAIDRKLYRKVQNYLQSSLGDYSSNLLGSLETTTTYLYQKAIDSMPRSAAHNAFLDILTLLGNVLAKTTNPLRIGPRSLIYRFLLSELRRVDSPADLSIITFNYDLVLERTLALLSQKQHYDVFAFPKSYRLHQVAGIPGIHGQEPFPLPINDDSGVSLLKLHGSMNWQSVHTSRAPNPTALFNPQRQLYVVNSPVTGTNLSWTRRKRRVYMQPIIVPPVSGKRGMMHRSVQGLWSHAAEVLKEADRIVFAGYSCPPLDLEARFLISENLRANPDKRVYVINPDARVAARYVDICGVRHTTIYTSLKSWVDDAHRYPSN